MTDTSATGYWNEFYASERAKEHIELPSQFAVFFLGEVSAQANIIDFGCGTGRDSFFFASRGRRVTGVDGSSSAVKLCNARAADLKLSNANFICANLGDADAYEQLHEQGPAALYARFFIHAITDEVEMTFLKQASRLVGDEILAVEFRTPRDEQQVKFTSAHYRRFVNPLQFVARAAGVGLHPIYYTEGFGFAKFRQDDAHVARILLRRA
jgi:ubiquinone/menaquinone biosynthesis C-methylase UbiE